MQIGRVHTKIVNVGLHVVGVCHFPGDVHQLEAEVARAGTIGFD